MGFFIVFGSFLMVAGILLLIFAEPFMRNLRAERRNLLFSERVTKKQTTIQGRFVGVGFILIGIYQVVLGATKYR